MKQLRVLITFAVIALGAVLWSACGDGAPIPVASVQITPALDTVRAGESLLLTATPRDASGNALTGRTIAWVSDDQTVATVDATGLVTGVGNGIATIVATSEGQTDGANVTVWVGVTGTWTGILDMVNIGCQVDLSITESETGAITGTSRLYAPCNEFDMAVTGTNGTGGVADSVSMLQTFGQVQLDFRGSFDGDATMPGGHWIEGHGPFLTTFTRQSLTPGALAPARVDAPSPAGTTPLLRREPK